MIHLSEAIVGIKNKPKSIGTVKTFGELKKGDTIYTNAFSAEFEEFVVIAAHDVNKDEIMLRQWSKAGLPKPEYNGYNQDELIYVKFESKSNGSVYTNYFPKELSSVMAFPERFGSIFSTNSKIIWNF